MKSYTNLEQSKKLAEILPIESADMFYVYDRHLDKLYGDTPYVIGYKRLNEDIDIPCWSLAALLNYIKDKCNYFELVYPSSIINSRTNKVENVYRLSTDMYDVYEKEAIDACYKMIIQLHEQKLL